MNAQFLAGSAGLALMLSIAAAAVDTTAAALTPPSVLRVFSSSVGYPQRELHGG